MNILGLDLSLRGTGMVAVPRDWAGDWSRIARFTIGLTLTKGATERARVHRLESIRNEVMRFAHKHRCALAVFEQYAFTSKHGHAHAIGELGGVVKCALVTMGLELEVVSPARARMLLGKAPRSGAKEWAHGQLQNAGAPREWTGDELDAFTGVNHWMAENNGYALMLESQPSLPLPGVSRTRARLRPGSRP